MFVLGLLFALAGVVGYIWCLVEAFSADTTQGVLCLCVPFYAFFFVLVRLDSEHKWIILGLMLAGVVGRLALLVINSAG